MPLKNNPKKVNPAMIVLARESRGISQSELAELLSVKQAAISKVENGLLKVSKEDLKKISISLGYPEHFFLQNETIYGMEASELYHRKRQNTPLKDLKKIYAVINIMTMNINKLLNSIDFGEINIPTFDVSSYDTIRDIANITRAVFKLPHGPIQNVISTIERAGGIVVLLDFQTSKIDAISRRIPGMPPLIFINNKMPPDRIRMNLCHELGHIVMHSLPNNEMEEQAAQFAGEFLMPYEEIAHSLENLTLAKLADLKLYWKVSMASLIYRAKELNKISQNQERYLYSQLAKHGYKTREPIDLDPPEEKPMLLENIINLHLTDLKYNTSQICDVLAINQDEFEIKYLKPKMHLRLVKYNKL